MMVRNRGFVPKIVSLGKSLSFGRINLKFHWKPKLVVLIFIFHFEPEKEEVDFSFPETIFGKCSERLAPVEPKRDTFFIAKRIFYIIICLNFKQRGMCLKEPAIFDTSIQQILKELKFPAGSSQLPARAGCFATVDLDIHIGLTLNTSIPKKIAMAFVKYRIEVLSSQLFLVTMERDGFKTRHWK